MSPRSPGKRAIFSLLLIGVALLLAFQNCAETLPGESSLSSSSKMGSAISVSYSPQPAFVNSQISISAIGGQGNYNYTLINGSGNLTGNVYSAPAAPETANIGVSDSTGSVKIVSIVIGTGSSAAPTPIPAPTPCATAAGSQIFPVGSQQAFSVPNFCSSLTIEVWGGGGGGGGGLFSSCSGGGNGEGSSVTIGSTVDAIMAGPGLGGGCNSTSPPGGAGGTGSGSASKTNLTGANGTSSLQSFYGGTGGAAAGPGGGSGGVGGYLAGGQPGQVPGGGGGGGAVLYSGGGGGGGGYASATFTSAQLTGGTPLVVTVGKGGTAGTSGEAKYFGGAGAAGSVKITWQ